MSVERSGAQAVTCELNGGSRNRGIKRLTDAGFSVRRTRTRTLNNQCDQHQPRQWRVCLKVRRLSLHARDRQSVLPRSAVLVQVSLIHRGGIGSSVPAAHAGAVGRGLESYIDLFVTQIRGQQVSDRGRAMALRGRSSPLPAVAPFDAFERDPVSSALASSTSARPVRLRRVGRLVAVRVAQSRPNPAGHNPSDDSGTRRSPVVAEPHRLCSATAPCRALRQVFGRDVEPRPASGPVLRGALGSGGGGSVAFAQMPSLNATGLMYCGSTVRSQIRQMPSSST